MGKEKKPPYILLILTVLLLLASALTWPIPSGSYERVFNPATGQTVAVPAFQLGDGLVNPVSPVSNTPVSCPAWPGSAARNGCGSFCPWWGAIWPSARGSCSWPEPWGIERFFVRLILTGLELFGTITVLSRESVCTCGSHRGAVGHRAISLGGNHYEKTDHISDIDPVPAAAAAACERKGG